MRAHSIVSSKGQIVIPANGRYKSVAFARDPRNSHELRSLNLKR
jgi:hypothetical protein